MAAKNLFGHQAIQCLLPVITKGGEIWVYHSSKNDYTALNSVDIKFINELANEVILFDVIHEGMSNSFDWSLLEGITFDSKKIVISGGVGRKDIQIAKAKGIASVLVDNKILHQEYSISGYKNATKLS